MDYISGNIRKAIPSALALVNELLVVNAQQVHHGGLEIMHMHLVLHHIVGKII